MENKDRHLDFIRDGDEDLIIAEAVENGSDFDDEATIELSNLLRNRREFPSSSSGKVVTEDEIIDSYLNRTMWDDFIQALYDVRLSAPLFAFMGIFLAYHLTIAPYQTHSFETGREMMDDLGSLRPMLSTDALYGVQHITLRAETSFVLPPEEGEGKISLRFHQAVSKNGNRELPSMFYKGVMFGITSQNSHSLEYGYQTNPPPLDELRSELMSMSPTPTYVLDRFATCNNTDWHEEGFGLYYSYADLEAQGRLSSDVLQPWKRVQDDVLALARRHKQTYVTVWYPHDFGDPVTANVNANQSVLTAGARGEEDEEELGGSAVRRRRAEARLNETQLHRHTSLLQQVIPTRTGMNELKSVAAVWLSAVNGSDPSPLVPPAMYQKAWTQEDHWKNFSTSSSSDGSSASGISGGAGAAVDHAENLDVSWL